MKSSIEKTGCDTCSCRNSDALIFLKEKCYLWENLVSQSVILFFYISKKTTKNLGKVKFLKSSFRVASV